MPTAKVRLPDGRIAKFKVPEGTTQEQVLAFANENMAQFAEPDAYAQTAQEDTTLQNVLAGIGGGMTGMYLGGKQILGLDEPGEVEEHRRSMEGLRTTGGGKVGEFVGMAAPAAATMMIPGVNTYTGAMMTGGLLGGVQPVMGDESRLANVALGAAGGAGGKFLGDKVGQYAARKLAERSAKVASQKASNVVKDATIKAAQAEGYTVPPSYAGAKAPHRILEGLSGKYKTNQMAGIKNQQVTNSLAKKAVGLSYDAPLTPETLKTIRQDAFESTYTPVRGAGNIDVDDKFFSTLDGITKQYRGASKSFPDAAKSPVTDMIESIKVDRFDADAGVDMVKILRDNASKAFRAGDNALGKANRAAAEAIEDQLERALPNKGMISQFREGRKLIAKTHSIEDALVEGTGNIDATRLASQLTKGKPLSGELATIAKTAQSFRDVTRIPKSGDANPLTILDFAYAGAGGAMNPALVALPAARVAARKAILSQPYQKAFVNPSYPGTAMQGLISGAANAPITQAGLTASGQAGLLAYPFE